MNSLILVDNEQNSLQTDVVVHFNFRYYEYGIFFKQLYMRSQFIYRKVHRAYNDVPEGRNYSYVCTKMHPNPMVGEKEISNIEIYNFKQRFVKKIEQIYK